MAVDPATLKMAAKAAVTVMTDEEARKKVIIIVLSPVIGAIILISLIFYMITMPFQAIANFFTGDDIARVESLQSDYGYIQRIAVGDLDYTESAGTDFSGVVFTDGGMEVKYFNQLDSRWADEPYGYAGSTVGSSGCGPTSLSIVVSTLTNQTVIPPDMCEWAYQNGYLCQGSGSYHSLIPNGARHFGLTVEGCSASELQKIVDALSSGKLVIAIMSKGSFTTGGHFIVLRGVTADGKILVADPASKSRSEQEWDLSLICAEANKNAGSGGPFWCIGR